MANEKKILSVRTLNRRGSKPQVERKRRARINKCLDALQDLVFDKESIKAGARIEKADILETTVNFIREAKGSGANIQPRLLDKFKSDAKSDKDEFLQSDLSVVNKYNDGYLQCVKNARQFLYDESVPSAFADRITSHLYSMLHDFNSRVGSTIKISDNTNSDGSITSSDVVPCVGFIPENNSAVLQVVQGRLPSGQLAYLLQHCPYDNNHNLNECRPKSASSYSSFSNSPAYMDDVEEMKQTDDLVWRPWSQEKKS
ncbi:hypothetical protein CHUAL_009176 [Chamberlinius hualienensis]